MKADSTVTGLPVITIGGFLGAGKTTLVNNLLSQARSQRFVVFVNDFGSLNIDLELVDTIEENRISLKNGCVCCSLNDDFVATVATIARQTQPPDAIVVEASGVADPRALDASLFALEAAALIRMETRVYVLDADHFRKLDYDKTELIIDHAVASDLILFNKSDLVEDEEIAEMMETFSVAAPYTHLHQTIRCDVRLAVLLGAGGQRGRDQAKKSPSGKARHAEFHDWFGESEKPVGYSDFQEFTKILQTSFFRVKGFVRFRECPDKCYLFQAVGGRASLEVLETKSQTTGIRIVGISLTPTTEDGDLDLTFSRLLGV